MPSSRVLADQAEFGVALHRQAGGKEQGVGVFLRLGQAQKVMSAGTDGEVACAGRGKSPVAVPAWHQRGREATWMAMVTWGWNGFRRQTATQGQRRTHQMADAIEAFTAYQGPPPLRARRSPRPDPGRDGHASSRCTAAPATVAATGPVPIRRQHRPRACHPCGVRRFRTRCSARNSTRQRSVACRLVRRQTVTATWLASNGTAPASRPARHP